MNTNSSRKTALIVSIIFIAFAVGFYWLSKDNNVLSTDNNTAIHSEALAQAEKELPIIATVKKISPETYQSFEHLITQYDPENEDIRRQLFDQVVGSVMKLVLERMEYASDDAVINFTSKVNDYLKVLLEEDPTGKTCFYSLFPHLRETAEIIPPKKSQAVLLKQIQATNELLISSEAGKTQALMSPTEYTQTLGQLAAGLSAKYGADAAILGNLEAGKKSPALACQISISFYDEILAIPDNGKKAALLRSLFSSVNN
ncbi:topoisomerase IV [Providencia vermicola]|uniref:topoisomerase IV n=1 Tax=Providencia vermicola TaxID=333965 RepID=UPI002202AFEB|nr:topoisomerase IV [Providencia stuartii]